MRHRKKIKKLGRDKRQRKALLKTMSNSLILKEKITTTHAKAKALAPFVERLITCAKKGELSSIRKISRYSNPVSGKKLIKELAPRYKERQGGYTRVIRLVSRKRDSAEMSKIELV